MIKRSVKFILQNSLLLVGGTIAGLLWANLSEHSYHQFIHFLILPWLTAGGQAVTVHYLVNDILMAFFFAIVGKEVWEATHPGGPLHHVRRAALPLICAVGGMIGPALIYLAGAAMAGQYQQLSHGWAIPCATDIVFSYLVARFVFGQHHPAVKFLLMLSIADDALGLGILTVFYPREAVRWEWLALIALALAVAFAMRRGKVVNFWWYLAIPGTISWAGFTMLGLHSALSLLPIVPILPHRHLQGEFDWEQLGVDATLTSFGKWWKNPVEIIIGVFALTNAGVVFGSVGLPTLLVLVALLAGKPLGIVLSGLVSMALLRLELAPGLRLADLLVIGVAAGIGFTVALFVATVAFAPGAIQDAAKMGALASFAAVFVTYVAARFARVRKINSLPEAQAAGSDHV